MTPWSQPRPELLRAARAVWPESHCIDRQDPVEWSLEGRQIVDRCAPQIDSPGADGVSVAGLADHHRERYEGEWLPEPQPEYAEWVGGRTRGRADPADQVTIDESVSMAFLVVLDSMTPAERVVFILHDVFRYSFVEVAEIVECT